MARQYEAIKTSECHLAFDYVFFFNDTATTEIYTLSLHDALPIWSGRHTAQAQTGRSCEQEHFRDEPPRTSAPSH